MKLSFIKNIRNGKYYVKIDVFEFDQIELENLKKFGSPMVSIAPQSVYKAGAGLVKELPLHDMNYNYEFDNIMAARLFETTMTVRIKAALAILKSHKDQFSGTKELNL